MTVCSPWVEGGWKPRTSRGSQYVSIRYSERLAEAGIEPSVGSRGDSYDNALAETINGLYKAELIHRRAPWKSREAVELATLEWVSWFNHHRLLEPIGYIPPAEAEANYYRQLCYSCSYAPYHNSLTTNSIMGAETGKPKVIDDRTWFDAIQGRSPLSPRASGLNQLSSGYYGGSRYGGYLIYPNKPNSNGARAVYSK